jgi:hypothetical protein
MADLLFTDCEQPVRELPKINNHLLTLAAQA